MEKEVQQIIDLNGEKIWRVTTLNERWYSREVQDRKTKLPFYHYYPSSTWIASYYPKGIGFMKWLSSKGWDEAQALKEAAGNRGTRVHRATELLDQGEELRFDTPFPDDEGGKVPLTSDEWEAVMAYTKWWEENKPESLAIEATIFNEAENYAGTLDRIMRIKGQIYVVDVKTSQDVWPSHILQLSSYSHADIDYQKLEITDEEWKNRKLAILQLGYRRNQKRYKFTEVDDQFDLFLAAKQIWAYENKSARPAQRDFPVSLSLLPFIKKQRKEEKEIAKKVGKKVSK
jgi:hypothetical protein